MSPVAPQFQHCPFANLSLRQLHDLLWLRNLVFVYGQKITAEPEVDGRDPECVHVWGSCGDQMVATARLFMTHDPAKVGRIAVHPDWQGQGIGSQLMKYIHQVLGSRPAAMSAQAYLVEWYQRLGWIPQGEIYEEAGIPHIFMIR